MGKNVDIEKETKFGDLTFIKEIEPTLISGKWRRTALVSCKCGLTDKATYQSLKGNRKIKCSVCYRNIKNQKKGPSLPIGESAKRTLLLTYKTRAKEKGVEFNLEFDKFVELTSQNCYYCGRKPDCCKKVPGTYGEYIHNTLDRVDNNLGYTYNNCVPCCYYCNGAKSNKHISEFKYYINKLYTRINNYD